VDDGAGDVVHGEAGNDVLHLRDGAPDRVDCGDGDDLALLDPADVIADATPENANGSCERVERREPSLKRGDGDDPPA
jgi:hypothetical protein